MITTLSQRVLTKSGYIYKESPSRKVCLLFPSPSRNDIPSVGGIRSNVRRSKQFLPPEGDLWEPRPCIAGQQQGDVRDVLPRRCSQIPILWTPSGTKLVSIGNFESDPVITLGKLKIAEAKLPLRCEILIIC